MEAKLKQRLIGAALIIAIAVIFIPMIFDNKQQPQKVTVETVIPAETLAMPDTEIDGTPTLVHADEPKEVIETSAVSEEFNQHAQPIQAALPAEKPKQIAQQPAKVEPQRPTRITLKADDSSDLLVLNENIAPQKTKPAPTISKKIKQPIIDGPALAIQLSSFGNQSNANALVNKLQHRGFNAFTRDIQTQSGQQFTRVFVGPESDRQTAMGTIAKLEQTIHMRGIVVEVPPQS